MFYLSFGPIRSTLWLKYAIEEETRRSIVVFRFNLQTTVRSFSLLPSSLARNDVSRDICTSTFQTSPGIRRLQQPRGDQATQRSSVLLVWPGALAGVVALSVTRVPIHSFAEGLRIYTAVELYSYTLECAAACTGNSRAEAD